MMRAAETGGIDVFRGGGGAVVTRSGILLCGRTLPELTDALHATPFGGTDGMAGASLRAVGLRETWLTSERFANATFSWSSATHSTIAWRCGVVGA